MFLRRKKHRSGRIGIIVVEKVGGKMRELATIGASDNPDVIERLVQLGREWIAKEQARRHPRLDLFGEEREAREREAEEVRRVLSRVSNVLLNGTDLILDRVFDRVGFNRIEDEVFRKLVKARLSYPPRGRQPRKPENNNTHGPAHCRNVAAKPRRKTMVSCRRRLRWSY